MVSLTDRHGEVRDGYFVHWRNGTMTVDLHIPAERVKESLGVTGASR